MDKTKLKTLNVLHNTYCRLMPSKISGVGVFAIRDIPKGKELFLGQINQKWHSFQTEELNDLDREILNMVNDFFVIEKDGSVQIPQSGLNGMDMSFYVNHSKNPNATTVDEGFTFVSLRPIKKGEEITVSYGIYDHNY